MLNVLLQSFTHVLQLLVVSGFLLFSPAAFSQQHDQNVVIQSITQEREVLIGVLAFRGGQHAMKKWQITADYLNDSIDDKRFQIVPLTLEQMVSAISEGGIDFALTNPGHYVVLESRYGASRIATLKNHHRAGNYTRYGAVIFTRSDNPEIHELRDLADKSFMAISRDAFGGYQMAWHELLKHGVSPESDVAALSFSGFPQDKVVTAVLTGEVDAGTVRAETLARMGLDGQVDLENIRILNSKSAPDYPYAYSTDLYPEWAFAKLPHTSESLAQQVAVALFSYYPEIDTTGYSWTIPLDYSPVHEVFKILQVSPYDQLGKPTLRQVFNEYLEWITAIVMLVLLLMIFNYYSTRMNRQLTQTQQELSQHKSQLEQKVARRTEDLQKANQALQSDIEIREQVEAMLRKSESMLRSLYEITHNRTIDFEQRIEHLLAAACDYYALPEARITRISGDENCIYIGYNQSGNQFEKNIPLTGGQTICETTALEQRTITVNEIDQMHETDKKLFEHNQTACYIGTPIYVGDEVFGTLCFTSSAKRDMEFTAVDQDIVHLMAQWIGNEMYRQKTTDQAARHQHELEHATRVGALGEMASGLAHEVNQPLTAISNYLRGYLMRQGQTADTEEYYAIDKAISEAERAAEIIKQMREFVRKQPLEDNPIQVNECIQYAIELVSHSMKDVKFVFHQQLENDLPMLRASRIQIEQVFINLFLNSCDAIIERHSNGKIYIETSYRNGEIAIAVSDDGGGIDGDNYEDLFLPFNSSKSNGLGLGLSISRSIIENYGGSMKARNNDKNGLTIDIILPIKEGAHE